MDGSREEREARLAAEAILRDLQITLEKTHRLIEQARTLLAEGKARGDTLPGPNSDTPG